MKQKRKLGYNRRENMGLETPFLVGTKRTLIMSIVRTLSRDFRTLGSHAAEAHLFIFSVNNVLDGYKN